MFNKKRIGAAFLAGIICLGLSGCSLLPGGAADQEDAEGIVEPDTVTSADHMGVHEELSEAFSESAMIIEEPAAGGE